MSIGDRAAALLERRTDRRGFLARTALVGTALATGLVKLRGASQAAAR